MLSTLFNRVLNLSLAGSVIVIFIMLAKMIFKEKFSPRWHYWIWVILIVKLMMPFDIESSFSKMPNIDLKEEVSLSMTIDEILNEMPDEISIPIENITKAKPVRSLTYIQLIWFCVAIGSLLYKVILEGIFIKKQKIYELELPMFDNMLKELMSELNIKRKVKIYIDLESTVPRVYGLVKPKIIISEKTLYESDIKRLKHILLHELSHIKRHDIHFNIVRHILMSVYFFNPIILLGLKQMERDCETACDETVLKTLTPNEHIDYGHTLISLINKKDNVNKLALSLVKKKEIIRRLKMIKSYKKASLVSKALSFILASGIIVTCMFAPQASAEYQAEITDDVFTPTEEIALIEEVTLTEEIVIDDTLEFMFPTEHHKITSPFGVRKHPVTGEDYYHNGIDIASPTGSDIFATEEGEVIYSDWLESYGKIIILEHSDGYQSLYAHCNSLLVEAGDTVEKNQVIATVGTTGNSTGPHVHFEIRKDGEAIDPVTLIE